MNKHTQGLLPDSGTIHGRGVVFTTPTVQNGGVFEWLANHKRIVTCWNAFAGFETAQIAMQATRHLDPAESACEAQYAALEERCRTLEAALIAEDDAQHYRLEHYQQCDLDHPPSKGWKKLAFVDVARTRKVADALRSAALQPQEAQR